MRHSLLIVIGLWGCSVPVEQGKPIDENDTAVPFDPVPSGSDDDTGAPPLPPPIEDTGADTDLPTDTEDPDYDGEIPQGSLVITEVMRSPGGSCSGNAGQYVEVSNVSGQALSLSGLSLALGSQSATLPNANAWLPSETKVFGVDTLGQDHCFGLQADGFYAFGFTIGDSGTLSIRLTNDAIVDSVDLSSFAAATGASNELDGQFTAAANDVGANWCEALASIGTGAPNGTPGSLSSHCQDLSPDPTDTSVEQGPLAFGSLVISEIMPNPAACSDSAGEYFAVTNISDDVVNLDGLSVEDNGASYTYSGTQLLNPGEELALFLQTSSGQCYGLSGWGEYSGIALSNSGDELTLLDPLGNTIDYVDYSGWTVSPGVALQLSADLLDSSVNDNEDAWCASQSPIGTTGDFGSPGLPNASCAAVVDTASDTAGNSNPTDEPVDTGTAPTDSPDTGAPPSSGGGLILSEVVDPQSNFQGRFVEIANVSDSDVDLSGYDIRIYANGSTSSSLSVSLSSVLLAPGETWVVAKQSSGFQSVFGGSADQLSGSINFNGNDAVTLENGGVIVDVFGEIGVNGTGSSWDYEDQHAARQSSVSGPSASFDISQWTISSTSTPSPGTYPNP